MTDRIGADTKLIARLDRVSELVKELGPKALGHRVKRLRESQGLSIREVSSKASISKSSVVRLEQGRGSNSITVVKICAVLGVHIERLLEPDDENLLAVVHRKSDDRWFDVADPGSSPLLDSSGPLSESKRRLAVKRGAKVPVNILKSRLAGGKVLPSILEIYEESPLRSHVGEEFVYVLSGKALVRVGKQDFVLKKGESLTFWSAEQHSYAPADPKAVPVQILSVRVEG